MSITLWIVFMLVAIVSFIPITILGLFNVNKKYHYFKYLSITLFLWTIVTLLRFVVIEPTLLYYLSLTIYPIIFALTSILFIAVLVYLDKKVYTLSKILLIVFFIVDTIIAFTNANHQLMIEVLPSATLQFSDFTIASNGAFFYVHTIVSYVLLIYIIILIIAKLYKDIKLDQDVVPFIIMVVGMIVGISLNVVHILFYTFTLDPTYIAFVLIISTLYYIFYIRDLRLILEFDRNNFILDNLREMYLVVNQRQEVVDASDEFLKSFDIDLSENLSFHQLVESLKDKAVIYESHDQLEGEFRSGYRYLHMQIKPIRLPFFKYSGKFYMFYDETSNRKYINDVNYVKSHDLMTELYNRNHFEELKIKMDNTSEKYALAMFDLDGLKLFNDYLGHEEGDQLIKDFADMFKYLADKHSYIPIRMGGDEFLIIAPTQTKEEVITNIKICCKQSTTRKILFSYGVAANHEAGDNVEKVTMRADQRMYEMKAKNAPLKLELKAELKQKKNQND